MSALTLPHLHWGNHQSPRRALMVHGLGSSAQTCWRVMEALADKGWSATAVDLRGHGQAPRASRYALADFAEDLGEVTPLTGSASWDLVIGHSIGAASAVVASATNPLWAAALVLLDPALQLDDASRDMVLANQRLGHLHHDVAAVAQLNPHWHPLDIQLKVAAHRQASLFALEHAVHDNDPWDVSDQARRLEIPTHILGAEQTLGSMFCGQYATELLEANPHLSYQVMEGAGHSVHRDKPEATIEALLSFAATLTTP
jgi:pimeloyl-ACP methyl ester carboxylesterase